MQNALRWLNGTGASLPAWLALTGWRDSHNHTQHPTLVMGGLTYTFHDKPMLLPPPQALVRRLALQRAVQCTPTEP